MRLQCLIYLFVVVYDSWSNEHNCRLAREQDIQQLKDNLLNFEAKLAEKQDMEKQYRDLKPMYKHLQQTNQNANDHNTVLMTELQKLQTLYNENVRSYGLKLQQVQAEAIKPVTLGKCYLVDYYSR
mgnify:CR=1 FL=1